jgi:hypothetical protein
MGSVRRGVPCTGAILFIILFIIPSEQLQLPATATALDGRVGDSP